MRPRSLRLSALYYRDMFEGFRGVVSEGGFYTAMISLRVSGRRFQGGRFQAEGYILP